jgi:hypothetical protein
MTLFPHDERITQVVGEDAYVRWMDDQNIGVRSRAEGFRVLNSVGDSLRRLHLTANAGKSAILSLVEAKKHFHFETNRCLDTIDTMLYATHQDRKALCQAITTAWAAAQVLEDVGEWQKVLKRFYRYAARARSKLFVHRARGDVKVFPDLIDRVCDYIRYVSSPSDAVSFVESLLGDPEQVYPDVNYQLLESLLKIEPPSDVAKRLRELAQKILNEEINFPGLKECKVLAPLLLLRYGDKRNMRGMAGKLTREAEHLPSDVTRSLCAVVSSCGTQGFAVVERTASRLLRNHLSEFVKLVTRIREIKVVPGRFKNRIKASRDSITGAKFIDMRSILAARILGLGGHKLVHDWLLAIKTGLLSDNLSTFDRTLIHRLWPKRGNVI